MDERTWRRGEEDVLEGDRRRSGFHLSIGVVIFSAVNRYLAKIMNGFSIDVEMTETHHGP